MEEYKIPGVYIEEIPKLPASIASVETAIPAFIGYTEKNQLKEAEDLYLKPYRIQSLFQYEQLFGKAEPEKEGSLSVRFFDGKATADVDWTNRSKYLMYYSLVMFFANGGGPCWIISVGTYQVSDGSVEAMRLKAGLKEACKIKEATLLLFPDATSLSLSSDYYNLYKDAIAQCVELRDRFVILDVYQKQNARSWQEDVKTLRASMADFNSEELKYAAAYFPYLYTDINFSYPESVVTIKGADATTLSDLKTMNNSQYYQAKTALDLLSMLLPASPAIAGLYAQVDNSRGVWKAPANINVEHALAPQYLITNKEQESLNVDPMGGKSINVIRKFEGRGPAVVWGARTLAGNDNEWRYITVRRFFNMVEESVKNATEGFVFEPNDRNTWIRVKAMIENYLTQQWKAGALQGTTTREAFFVHVGLNETMTEQDIWEGRMIIEIGMAVVRPAEFIILRFSHKMIQEG